jgi:hypothetical protein
MDSHVAFQSELLKVSALVGSQGVSPLSKSIIRLLKILLIKRKKKEIAEAVTRAVSESVINKSKKHKKRR